jgi:hypothetical protein
VHKKYWGGRMMSLAARPNIFYSASPGLTTIIPQTTLAQHGEQKRPELHGGRIALNFGWPYWPLPHPCVSHRLRGNNRFPERQVGAMSGKTGLQSH